MRKAVWLAYDLGVRGDYEGLYTWLDAHDAQECGDSVAYLRYEYSDSLPDELTNDIRGAMEISRNTRIYLIWHEGGKGAAKRMRGQFIIGGRKAAPWSGYAAADHAEVDEA